jgi:hypothetical protein
MTKSWDTTTGRSTSAPVRSGALRWIKRLTWYRLLRHLRKIQDKHAPIQVELEYDCRGQESSDRIRRLLMRQEPCMIARFGNNELRTIENHLSIRASGNLCERCRQYLKGDTGPWWWDDRTAREMQLGAGFFPATPENLERFARLSIEDSREIDILGCVVTSCG